MKTVKRALSLVRRRGLGGIATGVTYLLTRRRLLAVAVPHVAGRCGLEVGGPSMIFSVQGILPIYDRVAALDNCNFGTETVWEGQLRDGQAYRPGERLLGTQHVAEATALEFAEAGSYDFVLSSHALEHSANPLKALLEMKRVLKAGGALVLVLPHRDAAFDHRRPISTLEHLIADADADMDERDLTHLPEILELHDLARDPGISDPTAFAERSRANYANRCLHHHVFDLDLMVRLVEHGGFEILAAACSTSMDLVVVARLASRMKYDLPRQAVRSAHA